MRTYDPSKTSHQAAEAHIRPMTKMVENISVAGESSWCSRRVPALITLVTIFIVAFTTSASALTLQSTKIMRVRRATAGASVRHA